MRLRRLLALPVALFLGGVAPPMLQHLSGVAPVPAPKPTIAALPRSARLLAAGDGVVWAQLGGDVYRSSNQGRSFRADLSGAARLARDGGRTWHQVQAGGLPGGMANPGPPSECGAPAWLTVSFASTRLGFVAGDCQSGPALWETNDSGQDWARARFERPPGGWPARLYFSLPTVTAGGAVLEMASGLDPATDKDGSLVIERLAPGGSFRYVGRAQTDSLQTTGLDPVDAAGHLLAVLASGRLPSEGDELFESDDGGASWRLVGHDPAGLALSEVGYPVDAGALAVVSPSGHMTGTVHEPGQSALLLTADLPAIGEQDSDVAVYSTTDGGASWSRVTSVAPPSPPAAPYDEVAFATSRFGYLAGPAGVAVTTDVGAHITRVLGLRRGEQVLALDVTGPSSAVVLTTDHLLLTTDAGHHWQARPEPPSSAGAEPQGVDFVSPLIGFATGCASGHARLYRTVDGARSWQGLAAPATSKSGFGQPYCVASAHQLYYLAEPGLAALYGAGAKGPMRAMLYASADGGGSWRRVGRAPGVLLACSGRTVWADSFENSAMNFTPYVFRSSYGGCRFIAVAGDVPKTAPSTGLGAPYSKMTEVNGELETLSAFSPEAALLVIGCGVCQARADLAVSTTTDSGLRWSEPYDVLAAGMLYTSQQTVSFLSTRVGFVLGPWSQGPGEVLLGTADAGRSWRQLAVLGAGG